LKISFSITIVFATLRSEMTFSLSGASGCGDVSWHPCGIGLGLGLGLGLELGLVVIRVLVAVRLGLPAPADHETTSAQTATKPRAALRRTKRRLPLVNSMRALPPKGSFPMDSTDANRVFLEVNRHVNN
jgi:hypothetical protein